MQHQTFTNNRGGVFHRVRIVGSVKLWSVWYDGNREYVTAEGRDAAGRMFPPNRPQREALKRFIKQYVQRVRVD